MLKDLFHNADFLLRVFHESNSLVFILEKNLIVYDTNVAVSNQLGLGHSYIRSKYFYDFIWEEERENTKKIIKKAIKNRENINVEFYLVDKKEEIHLIKFKGFFYENSEDKSVYYILIGDDVTKTKLLEQSEMVEYQKFQSLFNIPGIAIAIIDLNSLLLDVNPKFCDMFGYTHHEAIKLYMDDLLNKREKVFQFNEIKLKLNQGSKYESFELSYKKKNGFIVWAFVNVTLHTYKDKPIYYVATFQDITDKKHYEIKLKEDEKKYKSLFNNSFNAIAYKKLIYDKNGNIRDYLIIDANDAFERVTGLRKVDIIGRPMKIKAQKHFHVTPKENLKRLLHYDRILKGGKNIHFRSELSRTFNHPIDVYYYIVDRNDNLIAVVFGDVNKDDTIMTL